MDRFRQPERVVATMGLARGQRVADVGAGLGYYTLRLADAVGPSGRVVATDIDDGALASLRARAAGRPEVTVRKVAPDDPGLEAGAYDVVLLSQVDQYLADRDAYLVKLRAALAPSGRLVVVNRRSFREPLLAAARRAGFVIERSLDELPVEYVVVLAPAPL